MRRRTCFITSATSAQTSNRPRSVADVGQLGQDVAGDHERLAHVAEFLQQPADFDPRPGVQAAGRLVEQEHLGIVQEHPRHSEPLGHAAAEARDQRLALIAQLDQPEHVVADLPPRRALDPIGGGEELQVLDHLHVVVNAEEVGHVADQPADFFRVRIDRVAADVRLAPGRLEQRGQNPHRGRFARPVRPDITEQVPLVQLQREVVDRAEIAVGLGKVLGFDH
jgi:hypothetical protein